jgi:hypothetical protein
MKNKNILMFAITTTLLVFGLAYAQDKTKSPPASATKVASLVTKVMIQDEVTTMLYKSINEITSLKPNQIGIDNKSFYRQAQTISRSVFSNPLDSPEVQKAKRTKLGLQGSPTMTIFRLETGLRIGVHLKGAVGIEGAIFPEWQGASGDSDEELRGNQRRLDEERKKNRKILWRWNVPKEFVNGYLYTGSGTVGGGASERSSERFLPVLLSVARSEVALKGVYTLYSFDATKGVVWERDMLPLLEENMGISGMGTVPDGSSTIVVASSNQDEAEKGTGGIRIIIFDAKGKITSMSDIKGVTARHFYRNDSLNSFRLGGFIMSIEGKKYEPTIPNNVSFDFFITKQGVVSRLVDEKGETIRGGISICADDKLAYSFSTKSDVAWDLSMVSSR